MPTYDTSARRFARRTRAMGIRRLQSAADRILPRSFMTRAVSGALQDVLPMGRILSPSILTQPAYRIFEEEVPREGVRISRTIMRARWIDGSTHLWIARRKSIGTGEGSSGLRFDLAVPPGAQSP